MALPAAQLTVELPRHVGRGGWYTLQFAAGGLAITPHDPVSA